MKRILLPVILLLLTSSVFSQTTESDAKIIADKIIYLANKTNWPEGTGPADGQPVKICLIGETKVTAKLQSLATTSKKPIEIKQVSSTDTINDYHIVFNSSSELGSLAAILKQVGASKILTVSCAKDFARYGIMVNLAKDGSSDYKFEVNTMVLDGTGIKLDASILKNAVKI